MPPPFYLKDLLLPEPQSLNCPEGSHLSLHSYPLPTAPFKSRVLFKLSLWSLVPSWTVLQFHLSQALPPGWKSEFYCIGVPSPISCYSWLGALDRLTLPCPGLWMDPVSLIKRQGLTVREISRFQNQVGLCSWWMGGGRVGCVMTRWYIRSRQWWSNLKDKDIRNLEIRDKVRSDKWL